MTVRDPVDDPDAAVERGGPNAVGVPDEHGDGAPRDAGGRDGSDDPDALALRGRVASGVGRGREFVTMEGYAEQFEERLGYRPFPGTLNVALDDGSVDRRERLDEFDAVRVEGWTDGGRSFGGVDCYPVELSLDREAAAAHLVVPDRTDHDAEQLELLAPDRLRDAGLDDGDRLDVTVVDST